MTRARLLNQLAAETFDILVAGAGIHGAAAACAAAGWGLRTALIDAGDFGAATSANSLKVIHGGLRYLQHADFSRMRESIRARRLFLALAPRLVRPQAFAIPTRGFGIRSRFALRIALALNDLISVDRNKGLPLPQHLKSGRILSKREAAQLWPMLSPDSFDGAAVWYDALAEDTERLTLSFALTAHRRGAAVANYVRALRVRHAEGVAVGIDARDEIEGAEFPIHAKTILNATGPWWQQWWPTPARAPLVGAWNVIVRRRLFGNIAVGLESLRPHRDVEAVVHRGARNLFFVPWRQGTMIGTVYERWEADPSQYVPSAKSIELFLQEINTLLPGVSVAPEEISLLHIGVQPASPASIDPEPDKHSEIIEGPWPNTVSIKGVKYTTGLLVGERAARHLAVTLGHLPPRFERRGPLIGAEPLSGSLEEQIRHAVENEFAIRLSDVILRRTGLGSFEKPDATVLDQAAAFMARLCGWSSTRTGDERRLLDEYYLRHTPHLSG